MRPPWTASCTACGERKNFRAKGNLPLALSFCVAGSAASNCRARGVTGIERIDERQHIADRAPAFGRSAPRLLLVPALCALSGRFLLLRRLFRKGSAGRLRVMHPVCIVARYVGEILQQALKADMLVVIAANGGRCVRSAKFCVFVVQHGHAARADSHAPLTDRADDRKIPVIQMKGHTVFPAIVEDRHLLFSILTEDGIAASAEPVSGIKRLRQGLERADRLRGKTANEKTRVRVDDLSMTSFAVIKHEPHLPFRYGSIIAGAVYNNTDSLAHTDAGTLEMQKNRLKGGFSRKDGPSDRIRTCGILHPNLSGILFPLVYSGFRRFLICFTYSLTLLSPLFPGAPAPSVVIYVVKNASRPVSGECSPVPDGKRFVFQTVCIVTLSRRLCKLFLSRGRLKG